MQTDSARFVSMFLLLTFPISIWALCNALRVKEDDISIGPRSPYLHLLCCPMLITALLAPVAYGKLHIINKELDHLQDNLMNDFDSINKCLDDYSRIHVDTFLPLI